MMVKIDFVNVFISCVLPTLEAPTVVYICNGDIPAVRDEGWVSHIILCHNMP